MDYTSIQKRMTVDAVLLWNTSNAKQDSHLQWILGESLEYGMLILLRKGKPIVVTAGFEAERLKLAGRVRAIAIDKKQVARQLRKLIRGKRIGINKAMMSLKEHAMLKKWLPKRTFVDVHDLFLEARQIKSVSEQKLIRKACSISDAIYTKTFHSMRSFRTEKDVADFMEAEAKKQGCEIAFPTLVASGSNASIVHHFAEPVKLRRGFCIIDFGVRYKGYCSDTTRTVYLGKPSTKEKEVYERVLGVHESLLNQIKQGCSLSALYTHARKRLGKRFTHGLGHGIGVEVHEAPNLKAASKDTAEQGMIFTVEPGIYHPKKFGIRIEDDVLVKNKTVEILTKTSKKLRVISW